MTHKNLDDILLPHHAGAAGAGRSRLVAFVPITIALIGVGAILFGGLTARGTATATASVGAVDPVVTGSIDASSDRRHDLEMLDR